VRLTALLLVVLSLASCSHGDAKERAASVSTTSTSASCELSSPKKADGGKADVLATRGRLQIAVVDQGASVDVVSMFSGCTATPVVLDGVVAALPVGGTVTHGDGLRCTQDGITVLSATSDDGTSYQATATTYRLRGTTLVQTRKTSSTIEATTDPDALRPYYEVSC
jgi:hypothetical protein